MAETEGKSGSGCLDVSQDEQLSTQLLAPELSWLVNENRTVGFLKLMSPLVVICVHSWLNRKLNVLINRVPLHCICTVFCLSCQLEVKWQLTSPALCPWICDAVVCLLADALPRWWWVSERCSLFTRTRFSFIEPSWKSFTVDIPKSSPFSSVTTPFPFQYSNRCEFFSKVGNWTLIYVQFNMQLCLVFCTFVCFFVFWGGSLFIFY